MTTVVVSPHLDDAVLSCGQMMVAMQDVVVENVFAGEPLSIGLTNYDRNSGWESSAAAVAGRIKEDTAACAVIGARRHDHSWLDTQYLDEPDAERNADVRAWLGSLISASDRVFVPLGWSHPDHAAVAAAARLAAQMAGCPLYVYEELPYRVLDPTGAVHELERLAAEWLVRTAEFPAGDLARKERAIRCYESQVWNLNVHSCLVPERYWKLIAR